MTADHKTIKAIAHFINDNPRSKIIFMVGAGISTSCGIPDFRSPKTGLYHNLSKLDLPFAEAVFDVEFFEENPKPFYTLAKELYPGKFKPSSFHYMMRIFQDKGRLQRIYTQNIDTLERIAGIDEKYIIEAHGSFAGNHCIKCKKEFPMEFFRSKLDQDFEDKFEFARCNKCKGLVKPNIVFFGEDLPLSFFETWDDDLLELDSSKEKKQEYMVIVAGTSLTVYPFASLPSEVPKIIQRALLNREIVGDFDEAPRMNDIVFEGPSDEAAELLMNELGWMTELKELKKEFKERKKYQDSEENVENLVEQLDKLELNAVKIGVTIEEGIKKSTFEKKK